MAKGYYPLIDILAPGTEWDLSEVPQGVDYVKKTKPRAGGGSMEIAVGPEDKDRVQRIRAIIDVKYGQQSKIGNIEAPIRLVQAVEDSRLMAIGHLHNMFDGLSNELVFGRPDRVLDRAVTAALNDDDSLDIVELLFHLSTVIVQDWYLYDGRRSVRHTYRPSRGPLSGEIAELIVQKISHPHVPGSPEAHELAESVRLIIARVLYCYSRGWQKDMEKRDYIDKELPLPRVTAKVAKRIWKDLKDYEDANSQEAERAGVPQLMPKPQQTQMEQMEEAAEKKREAEKEKRRQYMEQRNGKGKSSKLGDAEQSKMDRERERQEDDGGSGVDGGGMYGYIVGDDALNEKGARSKWMTKMKETDNEHRRNPVHIAANQMRQSASGYRNSPDVAWGNMAIVKRPLTVTQPARLRGRTNRPSEIGRTLRHPHRVTTDKRVFSNQKNGVRASLLIDNSGSMSLSTDQIMSILHSLPASIIGLYSGLYVPEHPEKFPKEIRDRNNRIGGLLQIIAANNRMAAPGRGHNGYRKVPDHLGGGRVQAGNVVDGPALKWLSKQKGPRYWVSDGYVTGAGGSHHAYYGDGMSRHLYEEAARFCELHNILRIDSMHELVTLVEEKKIRFHR